MILKRLLHIAPSFARFNIVYAGLVDMVIGSYLALRSCIFANSVYLCGGKFRCPSFLMTSNSSFFCSVENIIRSRSKKKMFRIYTRAIIAMVTYAKSVRYFPFINYPRCAMGKEGFLFAEYSNAIPIRFDFCRPYPTTSGARKCCVPMKPFFVRKVMQSAFSSLYPNRLTCILGKAEHLAFGDSIHVHTSYRLFGGFEFA